MFLIPHGTEVDCPPQGMDWYCSLGGKPAEMRRFT